MDEKKAELQLKTADISYTQGEKVSKVSVRDHKRATVRFTDEEYSRIVDESKLSGESIPVLLRRSHFRREKLRILFGQEDRRWISAELRRIGNNVNQIARRMNSGVLEGWHKEFSEVSQMLSELCHMVAGAYGVR